MTKNEIMSYLRDELEYYRETMNEYKDRFGDDSAEYLMMKCKVNTVWVICKDIGVEGI